MERWVYVHRVKEKKIQSSLAKSLKCRLIIKLLQDKIRDHARRSLDLWRFQVKQNFPFYSKDNTERMRMEKVLSRMSKLATFAMKKQTSFHYQALYLLLDRTISVQEAKLRREKMLVFRSFKILYYIERSVVEYRQPLLIRNLNMNRDRYKRAIVEEGESGDIKPREIVSIMDNNRLIRERREMGISYRPEIDQSEMWRVYYNKFLDKRQTETNRVSDAVALVSGMWALNKPFFCLRDYVMVKLMQRFYIKWSNSVYHRLKFNKDLINATMAKRRQLEQINNKFRHTWSRIMLRFMIREKIQRICETITVSFETTRKRLIIENNNPEDKPSGLHNQILKVEENENFEDLIRASFRLRVLEVKKTFSKHFLLTVMRPDVDHRIIKRDLIGLLIDTMYYITCGTLQDAHGQSSPQQ